MKFVPKLKSQKAKPQSAYIGNAIALSGSVAVAANATASVNSDALKNTTGGTIEIREIRFQLSGSSSSQAAPSGAAVSASIQLGDWNLTNGPVPVWVFGGTTNLDEETTTGVTAASSEYYCKLAQPLRLLAQQKLTVAFTNTGITTDTITCRITILGKVVQAKPKKSYIPWFTSYSSKTMNGDDADTDNSTETDLANPYTTPLRVERFVGRLPVVTDGASSSGNGGDGAYFDLSNNLVTVKMIDSAGYPIVRNSIPFRALFETFTRTWECPHIMAPKNYYTVYLTKATPTNTYAASGVAYLIFKAQIGMVGYREVTL